MYKILYRWGCCKKSSFCETGHINQSGSIPIDVWLAYNLLPAAEERSNNGCSEPMGMTNTEPCHNNDRNGSYSYVSIGNPARCIKTRVFHHTFDLLSIESFYRARTPFLVRHNVSSGVARLTHELHSETVLTVQYERIKATEKESGVSINIIERPSRKTSIIFDRKELVPLLSHAGCRFTASTSES